MGACLSCLGLQRDSDSNANNNAERQRLLFNDDPYSHHGHGQHNGTGGSNGYGSWNQSSSGAAQHPQSQTYMSPEEVKREQQALNNITRWASDQIVEIFPHRTALANISLDGNSNNYHGSGSHYHQQQQKLNGRGQYHQQHYSHHSNQQGNFSSNTNNNAHHYNHQNNMNNTNNNGSTADYPPSSSSSATTATNPHQASNHQHHQDILLNMIPGDKSKRSIRIYPAATTSSGGVRSTTSSRPGSSRDLVNTRDHPALGSGGGTITSTPSTPSKSAAAAAEERRKKRKDVHGVFVKLDVDLS